MSVAVEIGDVELEVRRCLCHRGLSRVHHRLHVMDSWVWITTLMVRII